jgi:hypothetical protein
VKRYIEAHGWLPYRRPRRDRALPGLENWVADRFWQHRGNADVVRQDLERERGVVVSLRTVERAVAPLRQELRAQARATVRFETPPGRPLQIDFGELRVPIGGEQIRVHLFVATLGYSRRNHVQAFRHERQSAWFDGIEAAFAAFGGAPQEVLLDNARALVEHHDAATREVRFNARLLAFARYWASRRAPVRRIGRGPKARTSAAWATSRATPSPATSSKAGRRWKRIWRGGRARSPTCACTARPARRRSSASGATRRRPCGRSTGGHRSARCVI